MTGDAGDAALARTLAEGAGELLLAVQRSGVFEGETLGAAGDRVANAFLIEALRARRRGDAILSEEEKDDKGRRSVVDPLRPFSLAKADVRPWPQTD